ncbi:RagB/SusD family nutrient uptake outer membrane protein [Jiulongibacter sediminis]|uniref:RagB/SusD family nutrient uptake outer membrane protein n=1 Tax=Jiulongibacter sediminis TaxID=1605367 RepID=UPI0026EE302A|nr:RagB/SusD family nutrient uptake outer membrane protein [Jiulongibacter sediminis]
MGCLTLASYSCTDLQDVALDKVIDGSSISPQQLLASAYGRMYVYASNRDAFALNEHSTDELQGPTRGTDWDDNGQWRQIHEHTWGATHDFVVTSWDDFNLGHALANEVLNNPNSSQQVRAEALFVRSFFIYQIMDLFGQVPFNEVDGSGLVQSSVLSRAEAFDRVVTDLETALPSLESAPAAPSQNIKATKEAAQALLAKLYLNKAVYTNGSPAGPFTFNAADMDQVIANCDAIINSGKFSLSENYFDNWDPQNHLKSKELVFNFPYTAGVNPNPNKDNYAGNQRMVYPGLHYNQNPSGWNGFTTLADFYNSFEDDDARLGGEVIDPTVSGITNGFLVGQQKGLNGVDLTDRQGNPLVYTPDCPLNGANERQGIRILKVQPDFNNPINGDNDFAFIRYADVLLMKAEALLRKGNASEGLTIVNQVRAARGLAAASALTEASLLAERGHEFYFEGWRRNDLIRFDKFNDPVINRSSASPVTRRLFPIPQKEIEINPNLTQNDGY